MSLFSTFSNMVKNDPVNQLTEQAPLYASLIQQQSQQLWEREDSAYQRMVEDMKKAGLNPWTGISSGGLSAGSNVPALDSLTGLLNVLNTSISNKSLYVSGINAVGSNTYKMGQLMTKLLDSIGKIVGGVAAM